MRIASDGTEERGEEEEAYYVIQCDYHLPGISVKVRLYFI